MISSYIYKHFHRVIKSNSNNVFKISAFFSHNIKYTLQRKCSLCSNGISRARAAVKARDSFFEGRANYKSFCESLVFIEKANMLL